VSSITHPDASDSLEMAKESGLGGQADERRPKRPTSGCEEMANIAIWYGNVRF